MLPIIKVISPEVDFKNSNNDSVKADHLQIRRIHGSVWVFRKSWILLPLHPALSLLISDFKRNAVAGFLPLPPMMVNSEALHRQDYS